MATDGVRSGSSQVSSHKRQAEEPALAQTGEPLMAFPTNSLTASPAGTDPTLLAQLPPELQAPTLDSPAKRYAMDKQSPFEFHFPWAKGDEIGDEGGKNVMSKFGAWMDKAGGSSSQPQQRAP